MSHMSHTQVQEMSSTRVVQPSRTFDHVYDPTFTVASTKAHVALHQQAKMTRIERVPAYTNMFSDSQRFPRHLYRMKPQATIPLSAAMEQTLRGGTSQKVNHIKQSHDASVKASVQNDVIGKDRVNYFKRPMLPYLQATSNDVLVKQEPDIAFDIADIQETEEQPKTKSVEVQAMYRESGAQTEPYTRDYITAEGEAEPEILSIAHLTFGNGLPASLNEINLIHRMREKKKFEALLPPVTDEASFQARKRMLEERELREWQLREDAMKKEQADKLQKLVETLKAREEKKNALSDARVEMVRQERVTQRDRKFAQIHHERIKVHRSLNKARKIHGEKLRNKRDIIAEHTQYSSKVYAPRARDGRLAVKNQVVDYGIPLINNYQGLLALEKGANKAIKNQQIDIIEKPNKILLEHEKTRKGQKILSDLEFCNDILLDVSNNSTHEKKIENVYKKFEPVLRAPTPYVNIPSDDEEQRAVLLLQRLLRGRAVQNRMFQGRDRTLHLIRELRLEEEAKPIITNDPEYEENIALDTLQGEIMGQTLDFITKEIQRMRDEQEIARLVQVATETRRIREAEEAGRRQAEEFAREKAAKYHDELMDVHMNSAELFLDEIFENAVENVAHKKSYEESHIESTSLNDMINMIEHNNNDAETIVNDLVSNFLFKEVERKHVKMNTNLNDRKYINAAHVIVTHLINEVTSKEAPVVPLSTRNRSIKHY